MKDLLRDSPLNFDRTTVSGDAEALVAHFLAQLLKFESNARYRTRARKPIDQAIFDEQVKAIVCDLLFNYLKPPKKRSGWLSVSLSHRLHGRHQLQNSTLGKTLELLEAMRFIRLEKGKIGTGLQTRLCLTVTASEWIDSQRLRADDFKKKKPKQLIQLRSPKDEKKKYKLLDVDYDDPTVRGYLDEVLTLNSHYQSADIVYHAEDGTDDSDRFVYRVFTEGSFESCGRLYGGFWQGLSHEDRIEWITINDENLALLDFGQSALRLAYAEVGAVPPMTDLYAIPGYGRHRDFLKRRINQLLNTSDGSGFSYLPKALRSDGDSDERVIMRLMLDIAEFHKPIAHLFHSDIGQRLMFKESEIVIDSLITMVSKGITALPVGDGVYVQESMIDDALAVMTSTYVKHCGFEPLITIER